MEKVKHLFTNTSENDKIELAKLKFMQNVLKKIFIFDLFRIYNIMNEILL